LLQLYADLVLLQTGRWAWNPNFISMDWFGNYLLFSTKKRFLFLEFILGLSVHQHYWAIFAVGAFYDS
jgi:hypothetical protein